MDEVIDIELIDYIISLYKDKNSAKFKKPYNYTTKEGATKAIQTEIETISYHISRFVSESEDFTLLSESEKALKIIKQQCKYGHIKDVKINLSILSIFLGIKPGFPAALPYIKRIVKKESITIKNLVKIIETPKFEYNYSGGGRRL